MGSRGDEIQKREQFLWQQAALLARIAGDKERIATAKAAAAMKAIPAPKTRTKFLPWGHYDGLLHDCFLSELIPDS
jgi:hypothetical protein